MVIDALSAFAASSTASVILLTVNVGASATADRLTVKFPLAYGLASTPLSAARALTVTFIAPA